jgi:uncharacterized protein (TIGR03067 family)
MPWLTLQALSLVLIIAQGEPASGQADLKALQGTWQATSYELKGQTAPPEFVAKGRYAFEKEQLTMFEGEEIVGKVRIVLHPETSPKGIDWINEAPGQGKGGKVEGIYEIKDGTLKLCFSKSKRPTEFVSAFDACVMTFQQPAPRK